MPDLIGVAEAFFSGVQIAVAAAFFSCVQIGVAEAFFSGVQITQESHSYQTGKV